ncbi:hypothetical protein RHGRI_014023 [Rhododendron griersonianum]|uniref:Uncharacterized protein n=1 Tax=Rhododendron griersonianum TaxID=479676 RepID=A0AAV6K7S7_9ERIC|nr:hypothetical protein RHGRI_014023 [Rhododendron griersonianum]
MGQLMWPNMMSHNMQPNMAQGGSVLPFSPSLCPIGTSFNQFINNFPSSQSTMPSFTGTQVWGRGQSSFWGDQHQGWEGAQSSLWKVKGKGGEEHNKVFDIGSFLYFVRN